MGGQKGSAANKSYFYDWLNTHFGGSNPEEWVQKVTFASSRCTAAI
jgi:hypothetical protein